MYGGELIAKQGRTCVFKPEIPCKGKKKKIKSKRKKRVSKIIFSKKSKEKLKQEKNITRKIKSIPHSNQWAVLFDEFCKPPTLKKIIQLYPSFKECTEGQKSKLIKNFNKNSQMMNGIYGGLTFEKHFKKIKLNDKDFLQLMKMMVPLFKGLTILKKNNVSHLDIKYSNIVLHNHSFKYIDFGFSYYLSDLKKIRNRSKSEFDTDRIYQFYPLEFIYSSANHKELNEEYDYYDSRKNYKFFKSINSLFHRNTKDIVLETIKRIQSKKINQKKLFQKVDVYSLGLVIPTLFIKYKYPIELIYESEIIHDFFQLFNKMTHPFYNERITCETAFQQFKLLIKKYN